MCAVASLLFSKDVVLPSWQSVEVLLVGSCDWAGRLGWAWLPCCSLRCRPLCSASRESNCFPRPGTALRWVREWVLHVSERVQGFLLSGSRTPQCLLGSNTLPDTLLYGLVPLVPFWCFLSSRGGGAVDGLSNEEEGEGVGLLSRAVGDGEGEGLLSSVEGEGLGAEGPLPFRTRSWGL